jgi:CubicO group peptidase (beta-lactamase class C family)
VLINKTSWMWLLVCLLSACNGSSSKDDPETDTDTDADTDTDTDTDTDADADKAALLAELDSYIETEMEDGRIPGMGIAIIANDEVVYAQGYGWANIEDQLPVTADTPFMLASISKVFTGTALMQAVEAGALSLDDSINDLLPFEVDNPLVDGEDITVRHLATHSSGIRDRGNVWGQLGDPDALYVYGDSEIPLGEFLEGYLVEGGEWYNAERNFYDALQGDEYHYSNIASALAGYLLEVTTGVPLDDHSDANIFGPLGLTNTGWHLADHDESLVAMPYRWSGGQHEPFGHFGYPDYPDGQLRSSPADLARFMLAYGQGGALEGVRILESATVEQMWEAQYPSLEPTQGIFWYWDDFSGRAVIGHNGSDYGVATDMYYDPETGVGIVALVNADTPASMYASMWDIEHKLLDVGDALSASP